VYRVSDLLHAGSGGIYIEMVRKTVAGYQILHDVLGHGATADIAVANK
jgi:hypothetical protein